MLDLEKHDALLPLSDSQVAQMSRATSRYQEALMVGEDKPFDYLLNRGLSVETVTMFRLGVVDDPLAEHMKYTGMISIPYLDAEGKNTYTHRFRCLKDHSCKENHHGKYNSVAGSGTRIFNIRAIQDAGSEIHVAEGEFDAMILTQCGMPAVAAPGANTWQPRHTVMLGGFERVYIWGDPDEAGAKFSGALQSALQGVAVQVRLRDHDVTDTYLEGGKDSLVKALEEVR